MGEKDKSSVEKSCSLMWLRNSSRKNNPPITRITFDRLLATGNTAAMAKEKLRLLWSGRHMTQCVSKRQNSPPVL